MRQCYFTTKIVKFDCFLQHSLHHVEEAEQLCIFRGYIIIVVGTYSPCSTQTFYYPVTLPFDSIIFMILTNSHLYAVHCLPWERTSYHHLSIAHLCVISVYLLIEAGVLKINAFNSLDLYPFLQMYFFLLLNLICRSFPMPYCFNRKWFGDNGSELLTSLLT